MADHSHKKPGGSSHGSHKSGSKNQGNQWGDTGSEGNIKHLPFDGATDKKPPKRGPVSSKKGRDLSIGKS